MELSNKNWKLAFSDGSHERFCSIAAGSEKALLDQIGRAKAKFGLEADAPVLSGYEAGRDGFWIHRMLQSHGIENHVMDPSSIEVPRRARARKTDRLDAKKLLKLLLRRMLWAEQDAFSSVCVPSEEEEAALRVHRERERLVKERTAHRGRIRSLLVLHGIRVGNPATVALEKLKDWKGRALPVRYLEEVGREQSRLVMVEKQLRGLEQQQAAALSTPQTLALEKAKKLHQLKSVGVQSCWLLSHECFAWRRFANRKHLGSFAGLTGTPHDSGDTLREQGISKAGSSRVRTGMIELAWLWVRWQPRSALTLWFKERYQQGGNKRSRRVGIVALARKLLIALWKYVEQDIVPEGAILRG